MSGARDTQIDVCVVIAVAGSGQHLAEQLNALARQRTDLRWELIIADNGMLPSALTAVAAAPIAGRVVDARAVRGPAYARNAGAQASQAPLLLFCDDDDIVDVGWLDALAKALRHADLVGGRLRTDRLNPESPRVPPKQYDDLPTVHGYLPYVVSCSMGVRRAAFEAVGGFDSSMPTSEDVDLSWRLQAAGATTAFVPEAVLDYRIRDTPLAHVRQQAAYGRSSGVLRVKYRDVIAPLRISDEIRLAARLAVGLRHVPRRGPRRTGWWAVVRYWGAERRVLLAAKIRPGSKNPGPRQPATMTRPLRVWTWPDQTPPHYLASLIAPAVWASGSISNESRYQNEVLGAWSTRGTTEVQLCSPREADVAVLPFTLEAIGEHPELWEVACRLAAQADAEHRVMLVFCHGDLHLPAPGTNCVMFRTALDRSSAGPTDVALPAWIADPRLRLSAEPRPHVSPPSVSFTGWAHPLGQVASGPARIASWTRFAIKVTATRLHVSGRLQIPEANAARVVAIQSMRASRSVEFRLRLRSAMVRLDLNRADDQDNHLQLLQDIAAADYGLAVRGFGNYSYRLYEVLASGRSPLIIDTGAMLPRAEAVDWDRIAVTVPFRDVARAGARLRAAHDTLSDTDWTRLQAECRKVWADHLSADGFFRGLVDAVIHLNGADDGEGLRPTDLARALR